jgi:hypothetical protein
MTATLDFLADDLLVAATGVLRTGTATSTVGIGLTPREQVWLLAGPDAATRRVVSAEVATAAHADLVDAAERLATAWVGELSEATRMACESAMRRNRAAHYWVYVRCDTGELALALGDGEKTIRIANRVVESMALTH